MQKPNYLKPLIDNIPLKLRGYKSWVLWKAETKTNGQWTKVPYSAKTFSNAKTNDRRTWSDFTTVCESLAKSNGDFDGIGFVLSKNDPFFGIDIDHCVDTNPEKDAVKEPFSQYIENLATYTEYSPSGQGLHVIGEGTLPENHQCRKGDQIEVYSHGRYITVTGATLDGKGEIKDANERVNKFYNQIFNCFSDQENRPTYLSDLRIKTLFDGDTTGYPSRSEADLAFVSMLAKYESDPKRIDAIFKESKLYRNKWDKKHYSNGQTYGQHTIAKALSGRKSQSANHQKIYGIQGASLDAMKTLFSQKIDWVWFRHIPKGLPSMLSGREGIGKTTIALQIAKEILEDCPEQVVYWFATEGTVADTYIKAIELNLPNDRFCFAQKTDGGFVFDFKIPRERELITTLLKNSPMPVTAVFIDSVRGMTSQSTNDEETGNTMRKINAIVCDHYKASLIYLHHHKKGEAKSLLDRVIGSTGITSSVRVILCILPKTKFTRKIIAGKSNIAAEIPQLDVIKHGENLIIDNIEGEIDDTEADKAEEMILAMFKNKNTVPAKTVYQHAKEEGISESVLKKVKLNLNIKSRKNSGVWHWFYIRA